jgi:hypothetical protein
MAIYTIRIVKNGRTLQRKQVSEGQGRDAVVINAQGDAIYVLGDNVGNNGPAKITAKRVGKNLQIAFGNGNPNVPDIIIDGYFDFKPAPIGSAIEGGGQAFYDLGVFSTNATDPVDPTVVIGKAAELVPKTNPTAGGLDTIGWAIAGVAGIVAIAGSGGGKGGNDAAALETALAKVIAFAGDATKPTPTTADYSSIGIKGVSEANLGAINSAIDALAATSVDSKTKIQDVVDAYSKILGEANGAVADTTLGSNPTVGDYEMIGASIGQANTNPNALVLLNEVIGNLTPTAVDSIAEVNALASVVDKVITTSSGINNVTLTIADFSILGLPSSGPGAITAANLAAVNSAISSAGGQTKVDTYAELAGLATSVATIVSYAEDSTQSVPTLAQFTSAGITGTNATNLEAINSSVSALVANDIDTKTELQTVVDTYNSVLAESNGSAADATPNTNPSAAQYSLIGASIGAAATNSVNLLLLNDALANQASTNVDTISELNMLANAANAIVSGASGVSTPTLGQLLTLGIADVTANNLLAIQQAITATPDSGLAVDSMAELQALITNAASAAASSQTAIRNYADSNLNTAPGLSNYLAIGVIGVDVNNLASVNTAIDALTSSSFDTPFRVQTTVDAYNKILAEANGTDVDATPNNNPTATDFALIGANIGLASGGIAGSTDLAAAALSLLDSAIGNLISSKVDSVPEIDALGAAVNKVADLAKLPTNSGVPVNALTMTDLTLLGINSTLSDTVEETNAILQAIINSADTGASISTTMALQALVNANVS